MHLSGRKSWLRWATAGVGLAGADREDGRVQVAVLSDTHGPRRWKSCPPAVAQRLRGADLILHAGDVCVATVLDELSGYAPVRVVLGNNDGPDVAAWGAPPAAEFELAGLPVAMVHDSGARPGRLGRLRRQFPGARLVVFGHSHIPLDASAGDLRIFNPGSPTDRRRQPHGTIGVLRIEDGEVIEAEIVRVT
jgi:putative phosphoesterase